MSLFQRIKAPFTESGENEPATAAPRPRPVGEMLRERRQELRLDINDVGEILRIKPAFLAALEENRPQDLPGPTYVIGFVRAYARHLGLDDEWVLERYKAESAGMGVRPDLALPMPLGERSVPGGPILLVALILAICGYGTWYYLSTAERARPERVSAVPPIMQTSPEQPAAAAPDAAASPATPAVDSTGSPAKVASASAMSPTRPAADPVAPAGSVPNSRFSSGLFPGSAAATSQVPGASQPADAGTAAPPRNPQSPQPVPAAQAGAAPASAAVSTATSTPQAGAPQAAAAKTAPPQTAMAVPPGPSAAQPAAAAAPTANSVPAARIEIKASADCWVQVRAPDQSIVFSRVLKAGEVYRVPARPGLVMRTGNAGALSITVDGKPAPSIGPVGGLRRNIVLDPDALIGGTAVQG